MPNDTPDPLRDAARLIRLKSTGLLDTPPEEGFDRLTRLAARLLGVPVALVSLVDDERQFFKSCVGLPEPWASERETPLSHSFCQHVVTSGEPLVIEDARTDPRLRDNLAIPDIGVVAYLGIPIAIGGQVIGSFCVIDAEPRAWTPGDVATMTDLAQSVVNAILLRAESDERERLRRDAEAARERIEVTLASISDAVIATDAAGDVVFINPAASELCGWHAGEAVGRPVESVFVIVEEGSGRKLDRFVENVLATGVVAAWRDHTILISRDGVRREIEESASPIVVGGEIVGAVVTFRDVRPRKEQARLLREASRRLDHALSAGSVATFSWDIAGDHFVGDANMTRFYSIPPEEVAGGPVKSYFDAIHPDDRGRIADALGGAVESGRPFEEQYRIAHRVGPERWVIGRGGFQLDDLGRPAIMSGVVLDITERVRAEEAVRKGEERYRALFDSIDEGFCVFEMINDDSGRPVDYRFLEVNPAFEKHTGLRDAVGRRIRELAPDHEEFWIEAYGKVAATGEDCRIEEEAAALGHRIFHIHAFRVGEPAERKVAALFTDITHRRRAEQYREQLVAQLTEDDRRKDEFLAMLAHELRNPLGAISTAIRLVEAEGNPGLLAEVRDTIRHQVGHLTHLIDDLLDVSRITQGKIELRRRTVELSAITRKAAELARPQVDEKRHELTVSAPDAPVPFVADPTRVEQMLSNLLTNAAKYSEPGRAIHLSAAAEGGEVVFRVRDQGFGISAEMLPRVFGLFTQVDATLDRARGGLGIGLTLVRTLAEMHGGSITAASEGEGRGSEFTLRLPIGEPDASATAPEAAPSPTPSPARATPAQLRILIIDDSRDTARMTSRLLSSQGHALMAAHDGFDGIEAAKAYEPDVILLDIGLPGLNGYGVAAAIRDHDCCRDSVIVAVSGYGEPAARDRSKAAGIDHHLTKPLDFDALDAILRKVRRPSPDR